MAEETQLDLDDLKLRPGFESRRDAMIARLIERTAWMQKQGENLEKVTSEFVQTQQSMNITLEKLQTTVENFASAIAQYPKLAERVTVLELDQKWWNDLRKAVTKTAMIVVALVFLYAVGFIIKTGRNPLNGQ